MAKLTTSIRIILAGMTAALASRSELAPGQGAEATPSRRLLLATAIATASLPR